MYFPSSIYIPVFKGLLLSLQKRFSSEGILEPFNVGVLGQLSNIDPTKVNVEDIVQLRQKGEFNDFRSFLCEVFDRLHGKRGYYSDLKTEFASAVRSELREHSEQIKKMTDSSTVLREAFANSDRIIIAVGTGILPGAIANSPTMAILGGAAGAAGRILYDIVRAAILRSPNASRASFRNHFLALKTERS